MKEQNEKQAIEEMANEINEMDEQNAHYYDQYLQEHEAFADCFTIAKHLYAKDYRKQIVGEWVDQYRCEYANKLYKCSVCGETAHSDGERWFLTPYCHGCGARMKGGA